MKHILLVFILVLASFIAKAQEIDKEQKPQNLNEYDSKPWHFGFFVGTQANTLHLTQNPSLSRSEPKESYSLGFKLGTHALLKLSDKLDLKFAPSVVLTNYRFTSTTPLIPNQSNGYINRDNRFLELPLNLRIKTTRLKSNHKLFTTLGGYYQLDISKKYRCTYLGNNAGVQFGIGWDRYAQYFVQSMELSYQLGLVNQKDKVGPYTGLDRATMHSISLNMYFN
jgi:hypothetical protein